MVQPHHHTEHGTPPTEDGGNVVDFASVSRERRLPAPEYPIEEYLLSAEGAEIMTDLYETLDESGSIIKSLAFEISRANRHQRETIFTLFQHEQAGQGLTARLELVDLYKSNPLLNATLKAVRRKNHDGDYLAKHLYSYAFRVFTNMVRYEWLKGVYSPDDPLWQDRASRLGDFQGPAKEMYLQPGFNRPTTVERNSPSDYLENVSDD